MIFSDRYTEVEKYSIFRQEHICSSATMPWLYTSLVQDRYKPELSSPIKERLNAALDYTPFIKEAAEPPRNELKSLTVDYVGDTHIGYISRFVRPVGDLGMGYYSSSIKYFKEQTRTTHLVKQYDEMLKFIDIDKRPLFLGFKHDSEGVPTHLAVQGHNFDLSEYGEDAIKVAEYLPRLRNWSKPIVYHGEESTNILIGCAYTKWVTEGPGRYNPFQVKTDMEAKIPVGYDQVADKHIEALINADLLTKDQARYVYSVLPGFDDSVQLSDLAVAYDDAGGRRYIPVYQYMIDFEYVIKDGVLDDIILHRYTCREFKDVEVQNEN